MQCSSTSMSWNLKGNIDLQILLLQVTLLRCCLYAVWCNNFENNLKSNAHVNICGCMLSLDEHFSIPPLFLVSMLWSERISLRLQVPEHFSGTAGYLHVGQ